MKGPYMRCSKIKPTMSIKLNMILRMERGDDSLPLEKRLISTGITLVQED
jgi:hypothetical protein